MNLINDILKRAEIELEDVPVHGKRNKWVKGGVRSVGCILSDMSDRGIIYYKGVASGGSGDKTQLHLHTFIVAYIEEGE